MKKYFVYFICFIILLTFTACNKTKKTETKCINCDKVISLEDTYCKYCGTKNVIEETANQHKSTAIVMFTPPSNNEASIYDLPESNYLITFIDILSGNTTMETIQENLDFSFSINELRSYIEISRYSSNSQLIKITVSTDTKEKTDKILTCFLDEAPNIIEEYANARFVIVSID